MRVHIHCITLAVIAAFASGCPKSSDDDSPASDGGSAQVAGQDGHAGARAGSGGVGGAGNGGSHAAGSGAHAGSGGVSAAGAGAETGNCTHQGCSGELCADASDGGGLASDCVFRPEYACYQQAACERQADGACGFTPSSTLSACLAAAGADAGNTSGLTWQETCGAPLCHAEPVDDPSVPNCTSESAGAACSVRDAKCDLVNGCGTKLQCTDSDPTNGGQCPKSRARFKRDIAYLKPAERERIYQDLLAIPIASYEYKDDASATPQLGFIIEDVEPSPATRGDRVNLYGYLSMAVNAVQLQAKQIEELKREVATLRSQTTSSCMCGAPR